MGSCGGVHEGEATVGVERVQGSEASFSLECAATTP